MRGRLIFLIAGIILALPGAASISHAQGGPQGVGPGGLIVPQRDCQTIRTCRFERGGSYRGCLSSYTCRTCRFVKARCEIGGRTQNCQEMRCSWGG